MELERAIQLGGWNGKSVAKFFDLTGGRIPPLLNGRPVKSVHRRGAFPFLLILPRRFPRPSLSRNSPPALSPATMADKRARIISGTSRAEIGSEIVDQR
jgi:hypothetical protein